MKWLCLASWLSLRLWVKKEGRSGALIQWSPAKKQFKLRILMGSFLLQTFSFQGMHSYQKKNTAKSKFDLFALPILTNCSCLAFCLQSLVLAKLPCDPWRLHRHRAYYHEVGVEIIWFQVWEKRAISRRGTASGWEVPPVSLQAVLTSALHFCQAGMKWDSQVPESSKQRSLLAPTQLELGKRCLFLLSYVAFSVSFPISLWGRQSGGSRAAGKKKGWQRLSIPSQRTIL